MSAIFILLLRGFLDSVAKLEANCGWPERAAITSGSVMAKSCYPLP
jgi:hypothetical protein